MQPLELFDVFVRPLEASGFPYFATGSIASIFYGEPRLTHDIDIVIELSQKDVMELISIFPDGEYYCPPYEVMNIEIRRQTFAHFNVIHHKSGLKADFYPNVADPLHQWAFENRKRIDLSGISIWIAPPEYVILRKLEYYREGGSDKHIKDIQAMIRVSGESFNSDFLEHQIQNRQLQNQWKKCTLV